MPWKVEFPFRNIKKCVWGDEINEIPVIKQMIMTFDDDNDAAIVDEDEKNTNIYFSIHTSDVRPHVNFPNCLFK